jgi:hypothetical protein
VESYVSRRPDRTEVDCIAQAQAEDLADAGRRPGPVEGVGVGCLGRGEDRPRHGPAQSVVVANQLQVHRDALWHRGLGEAFRHPSPIRLGGGLLANLREVILTSGMWDVCGQLRALAPERRAAPEQVPGRAHGGGTDVGLGQHASTGQGGDLVDGELIVSCFAAVDGPHGEGIPRAQGIPS